MRVTGVSQVCGGGWVAGFGGVDVVVGAIFAGATGEEGRDRAREVRWS